MRHPGDHGMDMHQLAEFERLFGHRHEALALLALRTDGPMRWTDVGHSMSRLAKTRIDDKYVTRALQALVRRGLVETVDEDGNQLYTLTARGADRADRIEDIFARLNEHRTSDPHRQLPSHWPAEPAPRPPPESTEPA